MTESLPLLICRGLVMRCFSNVLTTILTLVDIRHLRLNNWRPTHNLLLHGLCWLLWGSSGGKTAQEGVLHVVAWDHLDGVTLAPSVGYLLLWLGLGLLLLLLLDVYLRCYFFDLNIF